MDNYLQIQEIVQSTGKALLQRLSSIELEIHYKDRSYQNLVTDCDIWVQNKLYQALHALLPEASFFAEEKENTTISGLTWIVDPIDGTTNFITQQKNYAICVALYDGMVPVFGVVYDVAAKQCYHAMKGKGAFVNGQALMPRLPKPAHESMLDVSLGTLNELSKKIEKPLYAVNRVVRGHRASGSASLAMCHIAEGTLDLYLSSKLFPWDYAAAGIILNEVNGIYTPLFETDSLLQNQRTAILCSGDEKLHHTFLAFFRGISVV